MISLISILTLLLAIVAGLGVLNTVVLQTRERTRDLGAFKVDRHDSTAGHRHGLSCSVAVTGLTAGVIAVPAGVALHHYVLPRMAAAAGTELPASFLNVYRTPELAILALSGVVTAVIGALLPAGWAARTSTASALHAE